jgi:acyl phosphate:glycerol-3-phosphate acyltransferase
MGDFMLVLYLIQSIVVPYLIGAIPVGAIVAAFNRVDIAKYGSGKIGTTNVLRSVGKRAAALVLLGDVLKGSIAVLIVRLSEPLFLQGAGTFNLLGFTVSWLTVATLLASTAVVAGHVWSLYLRVVYGAWHGGRGVATAIGALFVVNPLVILTAVAVGLPTIIISRYVSLGSILGAAAGAIAVVLLVALGQMEVLSLLFIPIAVFVIAAHRDNIQRLLQGTERKLGDRVNPS